MGFFDFIFPKYCVSCRKFGTYLCDECFSYLSFDTKTICLVCKKPSFNGLTHSKCLGKYSLDGCFSAISYNLTAKKLLYNFKHKPYLRDLTKVLTDLFYEGIVEKEELIKQLEKGKWLIVPVPLSSSRFKKRGYNQAEILAKGMSKRFNLPTEELLKIDRESAMKGAFSISYARKHKIQNLLLIDDIVVTGSTLLECASILKRNGVKKVFGLTLARGSS